MKVSKKFYKQIIDAISNGIHKTITSYPPLDFINQSGPDDWNTEETKRFDILTEIECNILQQLDHILTPKDESIQITLKPCRYRPETIQIRTLSERVPAKDLPKTLATMHAIWLCDGNADEAALLLKTNKKDFFKELTSNLQKDFCERAFCSRPNDWKPEDSFKQLIAYNINPPNRFKKTTC